MRTSDRITFVTDTQTEEYNPITGDFEGGQSDKIVRPCFVSEIGLDRSIQVFGDYRVDRRVVRLQRPFIGDFDHIEYKGKRYKMTAERLSDTVFYMERDDHA